MVHPAAVQLEPEATEPAPELTTAGPVIPLSMTAEELELTKMALRKVLKGHEGDTARLGHDLLARLEQIEEWTAVSGPGAAWRASSN
jgi:hypothetical protein